MPFNNASAQALSNAFRNFVSTNLTSFQRLEFERFLQSSLSIQNLRNVQLWTRQGATQRNFINSRIGQDELDYRIWIAESLIRPENPAIPTKTRCFDLEALSLNPSDFERYYAENFIQQYTQRIYISNLSLCIEYSSDSDTEPEKIDLDSPEFDDVLED